MKTTHGDASRSVWDILASNLFTLFNLMNALTAAALISVGSYINLAFLGTALCNLFAGIFWELRAKRAIERLSLRVAPTAVLVTADGERTMAADALRAGECIRLAAGMALAVDATVSEGALEVDEALLTGESEPVWKGPGDALLSGSNAVSGACLALVTATGDARYAARVERAARQYVQPPSVLMKGLKRIIRISSYCVVPLCALMFYHQFARLGQPLRPAVEQTASAVLGVVPYGLVLLATAQLAIGVVELARKNTLARDLSCIEMLARVDTLCMDKTGTLTEGRLAVLPTLSIRAGALAPADEDTLGLLHDFIRAMDGAPGAANATAAALCARFTEPARRAPLSVTPFSSRRKRTEMVFSDGVYQLGAPEFVLDDLPEPLCAALDALTAAGERVLLFARDGLPLAAVRLSDVLRPDAQAAVDCFTREGVTVRLLSGDAPGTVLAIAGRLGIPGGARDCANLVTDADYDAAVSQYAHFGRCLPEQKARLISAMRRNGRCAAMIGDGVNDIAAFREADCSVALAHGSSAACAAAQLVLLDSRFAALPDILRQGRRVVNNITRTAQLFLIKNITSLALSLATLLLGAPYPFIPVQWTVLGVFTVGTPAMLLALEPNEKRFSGGFVRNVYGAALPGAALMLLYIGLAQRLGPAAGLSALQTATLTVYGAAVTGLAVLLSLCLPFNRLRAPLFFTMTAALFSALALLRELLSIALPAGRTWLFLAPMALAAYPLLRLARAAKASRAKTKSLSAA